jgi:hypothetical protein
MTEAEIEFFRTIAERDPPKTRVREIWVVVGRRGGKDSIASLIAAYSAALFSNGDKLTKSSVRRNKKTDGARG